MTEATEAGALSSVARSPAAALPGATAAVTLIRRDMELSHAGLSDPTGHIAAPNGGFPEPPPGEPTRIVRATHPACGAATEIRLPGPLPADVVHRVLCSGCGQAFASELVEDVTARPALAGPDRRRPGWILAFGTALLAAAAVIAALFLIQSATEDPVATSSQATSEVPSGSPDAGTGRTEDPGGGPGSGQGQGEDQGSGDQTGSGTGDGSGGQEGSADGAGSGADANSAELVREQNFVLALPSGWQRANPPRGATFAARSRHDADATLWVERAPKLSVRKFEAESIRRLKRVARNVRVESRTPSPTDAGGVINLLGNAPSGKGGRVTYEVTLRAVGPFRYYLVTSTQPGARPAAREGVRLVHGSFVPDPTGASKGSE